MASREDIQAQLERLATYRRSLSFYLQQKAQLGSAYAPPALLHSIHDARENIRRIKDTLHSWNIAVDSHPDDAEPLVETSSITSARNPSIPGHRVVEHNHDSIRIDVLNDDVVTFKCDVLALKFAQAFYGADQLIATALGKDVHEMQDKLSEIGSYQYYDTFNKITPEHVLFLATYDLFDMDYEVIRDFTRNTMRILAEEAPEARHIAMTIHGVGVGLDEGEAFRSQIAGIFDALEDGLFSKDLEEITIVEINPERANRLQSILQTILSVNPIPKSKYKTKSKQSFKINRSPSVINVGAASLEKPHALVLLSSVQEMEDVFYYGLQSPINSSGYLCESFDISSVKPGSFARVKSRIETTSFIIIDVNQRNSYTYILFGYALGKRKSTILITQKMDDLEQDLLEQPCIVYNTIRELESEIKRVLARVG